MEDETTAKAGGSDAVSAPAAEVEDEYPVTLDEFCRRQSLVERSVELLGAFYASESALVEAGKTPGVALEGKFRKRLAAFASRPVG